MKTNFDFFVVKSTLLYGDYCILFNSFPHKESGFSPENFADGKSWLAKHGWLYISNPKITKKFSFINKDVLKVKLVLTNDNDPDLWMERYKGDLFLWVEKYKCFKAKENNGILKFFKNFKWVETEYIPHEYRISNKLFPEITEKDGIVGINIELENEF